MTPTNFSSRRPPRPRPPPRSRLLPGASGSAAAAPLGPGRWASAAAAGATSGSPSGAASCPRGAPSGSAGRVSVGAPPRPAPAARLPRAGWAGWRRVCPSSPSRLCTSRRETVFSPPTKKKSGVWGARERSALGTADVGGGAPPGLPSSRGAPLGEPQRPPHLASSPRSSRPLIRRLGL